MAEDAIVQDCEACGILVANHAGQLWLGHHVVLQDDVLDVVRGVGITRGPDHAVVVVKGEFILQAVPERALIERRVALEQIEIQWDVESIVVSAMALSAATDASLFPALTLILVMFLLSDSSMPWYWAFSLSCADFERSL